MLDVLALLGVFFVSLGTSFYDLGVSNIFVSIDLLLLTGTIVLIGAIVFLTGTNLIFYLLALAPTFLAASLDLLPFLFGFGGFDLLAFLALGELIGGPNEALDSLDSVMTG